MAALFFPGDSAAVTGIRARQMGKARWEKARWEKPDKKKTDRIRDTRREHEA